jgi:hypothetical protein
VTALPAGAMVVRTGAAAAQAAVDQTRTGLLGGRGPGASAAEIARHTRARLRVGGRPTADVRSELAERTARGDAEAVAAVRVNALGDTIAAIRRRGDTARVAAGLHVDLTTLAMTVFAVVVGTAVVVRRASRTR